MYISEKETLNKIELELFFYEKRTDVPPPSFRNQKNYKIVFSYVTRGLI